MIINTKVVQMEARTLSAQCSQCICVHSCNSEDGSYTKKFFQHMTFPVCETESAS
ncbi:hypothetical protein EXN66_Car000386 [Channa argus]|uniref:Uncharacterized protein n=1 Tax=Channa argus TaxID=215402 RepID=A0A6G1QY30_CHAAH|nr:hypothetical protein EXN66_Car000386 [Channa argus]